MTRLYFIFLAVLLSANMKAQNQKAETGILNLEIVNIKNNEGVILISLYNRSEGFPGQSDNALLLREYKIENNTVSCAFKNLPFGEYAVSILHDEDSDGEMNTNFVGIPKEGVGVSNDAVRTFGPPRYEDAKFVLKSDQHTITIKMHYY